MPERLKSAALGMALFILNLAVCWRLLKTEFLPHFGSIEGAFVSLTAYFRDHPPGFHWFGMWFGGMPLANVYQPLLFCAAAGLSRLTGLSPAHAYHVTVAATYSAGAVALYFLALQLTGNRLASFSGAVLFSLTSPSALLLSKIRTDTGGIENARRLQALVVYGEGPHVTGLTLALLALGLLWLAIRRKTPAACALAACAMAAVMATNWPAAIALGIGVIAVLAASRFADVPRILLTGALAAMLAAPVLLPSVISTTFANANRMGDAPVRDYRYHAAWAGFLVALAVTRLITRQFAVLYGVALGWIVGAFALFEVRMLPQPIRFHLALEAALCLVAATALVRVTQWKAGRIAILCALVLLTAVQFRNYRRYARNLIYPTAIAESVEYQVARVFADRIPGERVYAPGSISFWLNSFTATPQLTGCCEQSLINPRDFTAEYIIPAGFGTAETDAEISILWLKAFAVGAIETGGGRSREHYKVFAHPEKFRGRLTEIWRDGDDAVYRLPQRTPGLARIVPSGAVVSHSPANGADTGELRRFADALDDGGMPVAHSRWLGADHLQIWGRFSKGQALTVAINCEKGWHARINGDGLQVDADGLGLIVMHPETEGDAIIDLVWTPGREVKFSIASAGCAILVLLVWIRNRGGRVLKHKTV